MTDKDNYTVEKAKEKIKIDRDNLDIDSVATICTMIGETLLKEAAKFTDVVTQLTKTYKNEFVLGDFGVCLAISDGIHDEPIVQLTTGSIQGVLKNIKTFAAGISEVVHDKETV